MNLNQLEKYEDAVVMYEDNCLYKDIKKRVESDGKKFITATLGGSFSSVIIEGEFAFKFYHSEIDEGYENDEFYLSKFGYPDDDDYFLHVGSDSILEALNNKEFFPAHYCTISQENHLVSVVEAIKGETLSEIEFEKIDLDKLDSWISGMVIYSLDVGFLPIDVTPNNIMVDSEGNFKLIDVGLFQSLDSLQYIWNERQLSKLDDPEFIEEYIKKIMLNIEDRIIA